MPYRSGDEILDEILAKHDITIGELRSALKGTGDRDFTTLESDLESIKAQTDKLLFDAGNLLRMAIAGSEIQVPVDIQGQSIVLEVDTLGTESSKSGEIDTSTDTSPVTVLTPSSGKRVDTRSIYISTDSSAGEIEAKFPSSNILLGKIYCNKFAMVTLEQVRFQGDIDEPIQVSWTGVDNGAKIFWFTRYKEV